MRAAVEVRQHLDHGPFRDGIDGVGSDFRERLEDESTNRQPGMRNGQLGRVDDPIVEEQQVEVERPLAPADRPDPAEPRFDLVEDMEQGARVEGRLEDGGGVQEQPLTRRAADRLGLVERADLRRRPRPAWRQGRDAPLRAWPGGRPGCCPVR